MQGKLSDNKAFQKNESDAIKLQSSTGVRLLMLVMNFWPLVHIVLVALPWFTDNFLNYQKALLSLAILYLMPPLFVRIAFLVSPIKKTEFTIKDQRLFLTWWFTYQLQTIFCRLTFLEEILRMIPGFYSFWLRLWGAQIGRLTFWSAGVVITDRTYLNIGKDVIIGGATRLVGHVMLRNKNDEIVMYLKDIKLGDGCLVGGSSILTSGTQVAPQESLRAITISPPFSRWEDGKRIKNFEK